MTDSQKMHSVFVYGTLRKNGHYHHLIEQAEFVDTGSTLPHYRLIDLGSYPGLLKNGNTAVRGEVYRMNDATLADLDLLEEVPHLYFREEIYLDTGQKVWTYFLQPHQAVNYKEIPSGDYFSYLSN